LPKRGKASNQVIDQLGSQVDTGMIKANTVTSRDWPTIGLDYAETRFSKLKQITSDNVNGLGLGWSYSLDSERPAASGRATVSRKMYMALSLFHAEQPYGNAGADHRNGNEDVEPERFHHHSSCLSFKPNL
jgi:hypothetical protein